jgi:glycosyltransferase involved in cell wall biosynthesis
MKKLNRIVVMPVRNEEWILEKTLSVLSLFADHIIIADHNSTDRTAEICSKFQKVKVIKNESKFQSSHIRGTLLEKAREIEGNNVIFSFDADEIPSTYMLQSEFWNEIEQLPKGTAIELQWINLWRSSDVYRDDNSVWANSYKVFGFIDDRTSDFVSKDGDYDHVSRVPMGVLKNTKRLDNPKVLHFQFIDWEKVLVKQAHYRVIEYLQRKKGLLNAFKINVRYYSYREDTNIKTTMVPKFWVEEYENLGLDLWHFPKNNLSWLDIDTLRFFKEHGLVYFKWLDIWDIDWEKKRLLAIQDGIEDIPNTPIVDPRQWYIRYYHLYVQQLFSYNSILYKTYRYSINSIK